MAVQSKTLKRGGTATAAAVISVATVFTPTWEGMDTVARKDLIGTGQPVTYCYGQTSEFGKVKEGTRFTKAQCDQKLASSLPTYLWPIVACVKPDLPNKTWAALLDASYNAGPAAVCKSPMVAKINAGNFKGGCEAFDGWYIRSAGQVRRGLQARRGGELHGDKRKSERALCLEGLKEAQVKLSTWDLIKAKWRAIWGK